MSSVDWRVWRDDVPRPAALNMALDEALLAASVQAGESLLRIYRWAGPSVSFGYFDRLERVRSRFPETELVRRWTGGGAVEHTADVTFALAVPRTHPLGQASALESYRSIHLVLASVLRSLDLEAELLCGSGGATPHAEGIAPCFVTPVCADLMIAGQKVAGGAQRRTRTGLLHQGSLQGQALTPALAHIRDALAKVGSPAELDLAALEASAAELCDSRYGLPAWLERW